MLRLADMTRPVPLGICGCALQGQQVASEIERKQIEANTAAAIINIGARLRARARLRCGGLNEANRAVHAVLWRLLHRGSDLTAMSENDLQAVLDEISQT